MKNEIDTRIMELTAIIRKAKKSLENAPEGKMWISKNNNGSITYYLITKNKREYIRKDNIQIVPKLSQKDYDLKIIRQAEKEKRTLERLSKTLKSIRLAEIYCKLHQNRKTNIKPYELPLAEKIEQWKRVTYEQKPINNQYSFLTGNGEQVRSKSEVMIADLFDKYKIPYRYEYPLYLDGYGVIHPDFTVLNKSNGKEYIFEHFGMMGDETYEKTINKKLELYAMNGYFYGENLLYTFESKNTPLNTKHLYQLIEHFLTT